MNNKKVICKKWNTSNYFYSDDGSILKKAKIVNIDQIAINSKIANYCCSECGYKHFIIEAEK